MKPIFRTQFNMPEYLPPGEVNTKPGITVPNQALTVDEILRRYAMGLPQSQLKGAYYDEGMDPTDGVNFKTLDLSEQVDMINKSKEDLKEAQKKYNEQVKLTADIKRKRQYLSSEDMDKKFDEFRKSLEGKLDTGNKQE